VVVPLLIYYRRIPNLPIPISFLPRSEPFSFYGVTQRSVSQLTHWGNVQPFLATILIRDAVCLVGLESRLA